MILLKTLKGFLNGIPTEKDAWMLLVMVVVFTVLVTIITMIFLRKENNH